MDRVAASGSAGDAVEVALLAVGAPGRVALAPPAVLPSGAIALIRVAAEDREFARELADRHGVAVRAIEDAALHFVHSVMFHPDSDFFRVLGVRPDDDEDTLKLHFRWLQKWLHPDRDPEGWVSVYAERVNGAWTQLRRADRRAEYRRALARQMRATNLGGLESSIANERGRALPAADQRLPLFSSRWARRLPSILVGSVILLAIGVFAAHRAGESLIAAQRARVADVPSPDDAAAQQASGVASALEDFPGLALTGARSVGTTSPFPADAPLSPAEPSAHSSAGVVAEVMSESVAMARPSQVAPVPKPAVASRDFGSVAEGHQPASGVGVGASNAARTAAPAHDTPRKMLTAGPAQPDRTSPAPPVPMTEAKPTVVTKRTAGEGAAPDVDLADQGHQARGQGPDSTKLPNSRGDLVAVRLAPLPMEPRSDSTALPSIPSSDSTQSGPGTAPLPVSPLDRVPLVDPKLARRLLNDFSGAYRNGELQRLVVLFAPNARTPAGNLLDLHQRYRVLFGGSNRRSLEFVDLAWRPLPNGLEGNGRFEWARHRPGRTEVESASGPVRVVIEVVDERLLITVLEHSDVG